MTHAKVGDTVKVQYTVRLSDGSVFDQSDEDSPLEFTLGSAQVIPGVEAGVTGMDVGAKKTVEIAADQAYGPRSEEMVAVVARSDFPSGVEPEVGQRLRLSQQAEEGEDDLHVTVTQVTETEVTLDGNHPLAGQDLTFDLTLVSIS